MFSKTNCIVVIFSSNFTILNRFLRSSFFCLKSKKNLEVVCFYLFVQYRANNCSLFANLVSRFTFEAQIRSTYFNINSIIIINSEFICSRFVNSKLAEFTAESIIAFNIVLDVERIAAIALVTFTISTFLIAIIGITVIVIIITINVVFIIVVVVVFFINKVVTIIIPIAQLLFINLNRIYYANFCILFWINSKNA